MQSRQSLRKRAVKMKKMKMKIVNNEEDEAVVAVKEGVCSEKKAHAKQTAP